MKPALLIIDLQEDFLPPNGSLAVKEGRDIIPDIIKLMGSHHWATVITTKDWHPADHTSFASNHENKKPFDQLEYTHPFGKADPATGQPEVKIQTLWPDHCVQGSPGSEFAQEFIPVYEKFTAEAKIPTSLVKKGYLVDREYYSCFQDCWQLDKTECESILTKYGVTDVFVVGLAYDFCVLNSAIDSAKLGHNTYVIKDCARSVYPDEISKTDSLYKANGVKIINSTDPILNF